MKTKEKFWIMALVLFIAVMTVMVITGTGVYGEGEEKIFKVFKFSHAEDIGYIPTGFTTMDMVRLRSWIKMVYFTAYKLENDDLYIAFDYDCGSKWIVLINDREVIKELKQIAKDYGLKCTIPD